MKRGHYLEGGGSIDACLSSSLRLFRIIHMRCLMASMCIFFIDCLMYVMGMCCLCSSSRLFMWMPPRTLVVIT